MSSIFHATSNSFYTKNHLGNIKLLHLHYLILAAFTAATLIFATGTAGLPLEDLGVIAGLCGVVHGIRFLLDYVEDGTGKLLNLLVRHVADAVANYVCILFVIAVFVQKDQILVWPAIILSACLSGKELKYRILDDHLKRISSEKETSQGGDGPPSPRGMPVIHRMSRLIKSIYYYTSGFALGYLCLIVIHPELSDFLFKGKVTDHPFVSALQFSIQNFALSVSGDAPYLFAIVAFVEAGCAILLLYAINATPANKVS